MKNKPIKIIGLATIISTLMVGCNQTDSNNNNSTQSAAVPTLRNAQSTAATASAVDVTNLSPPNWYQEWQPEISDLNSTQQLQIKEISYYMRVTNLDLTKVYDGSANNPDNVQRIIRVMPKANFEKIFPLSVSMDNLNGFIPGKVYSYNNFLKAAAVIPGYCGDYSTHPVADKTAVMKDPDTLCKRLLATTFAHAVQETSDVDSNSVNEETIYNKIKRTFASVAEKNSTPEKRLADPYLDKSGSFSLSGSHAELVRGNYYYGRGAKQLSYPTNYANMSLMLYGNLMLLKDPDLVQGDNFLPFLSAIVYSVQPKNGRPSIAEIMDGSYASKADGNAKHYAELGFPFTIAIVNGGPECGAELKNVINTKTRLRAFRYFSKSGNLFPQGFPLSQGEAEANQCNDIDYTDPSITKTGARDYYFNPAENCKLVSWDTNFPIFGGKQFAAIAGCTPPKYTLTIKINGNAGINLTSKTHGIDAWLQPGETSFPNKTTSVKGMEDKEVDMMFKLSWAPDPKVQDGPYNCPKFIFNKSTVLNIATSSSATSGNSCTVSQ